MSDRRRERRPDLDEERELPLQRAVNVARPEDGGGSATPSFRLPIGADSGLPRPPAETLIGRRTVRWGERTLVMGIVNVTPDSFSGDGLLGRAGDPLALAVEQARQMVAEGADMLDVGGESTRPGHRRVGADEERERVVPVVAALHAALPEVPISIDTTRPSVASAALEAGGALLNDIWGVAADDGLIRVAAERSVPIVLMHNRAEARYDDVVAEVITELGLAVGRAVGAGIPRERVIVDPGFGFGKTPEQNLAILRHLAALRALGCPILLGTSRKSTLGRLLDLPPDDRIEATLATTVLAVAAGVDVVRVHDVRANVRVARVADAIVRVPSLEAGRPSLRPGTSR
jgi:dihydropteroate synthase